MSAAACEPAMPVPATASARFAAAQIYNRTSMPINDAAPRPPRIARGIVAWTTNQRGGQQDLATKPNTRHYSGGAPTNRDVRMCCAPNIPVKKKINANQQGTILTDFRHAFARFLVARFPGTQRVPVISGPRPKRASEARAESLRLVLRIMGLCVPEAAYEARSGTPPFGKIRIGGIELTVFTERVTRRSRTV